MIKLLDCTLRDGGYYNNWDFSEVLVNDYLEAMSALKIDYVEIGLRSLKNEGFRGACAYSTDSFINKLSVPLYLKDKIGVMVNGAELIEADPSSTDESQQFFLVNVLNKLFPSSTESAVSLVRIACHIHEFYKCLPASIWLKERGYKVGFNLMQIADRDDLEIEEIASEASKFPIDVLYFADSLGSLSPDGVTRIIESLKSGWSGQLGIHTHDNMNQALANSVQAVNSGVTWVDGTVTGMGRGPGNVQTEYLVLALDKWVNNKSKSTKLLEVIRKYFDPLKSKFGWGTNPYYYLAGKFGIHPSFIQEMLSDKRFNEEDILSVIEYLKNKDGTKFSLGTLESARNFYSSAGVGNWKPKDLIYSKDVLILGTGPSVLKYQFEIEEYIKVNRPFVIALNAKKSISSELIDIRAACHPVRLLADVDEHNKINEPLVTPYSMLPKNLQEDMSRKNVYDFGLSIDSGEFEFHEKFCKSPSSLVLAYALSIASSGKAKEIFLAGFDGYGADDPRRKEMDELFKLYDNTEGSIHVSSITPSRYEIEIKSIFSLLGY
jgi:4-hydroxy 2-oxovalerate aldolase